MSTIIRPENMILLCANALKYYDDRLVNHGNRVAYLAYQLLQELPHKYKQHIQEIDLFILSVFHDIGAYKTEDISRMIEFETENVDAHAVYGYLFFKHFTPMKSLAPVLLYHHSGKTVLDHIPSHIAVYSELIHLADRVDVGILQNVKKDKLLEAIQGLDCFHDEMIEALRQCIKKNTLNLSGYEEWMSDYVDSLNISFEQANAFLEMLIYTMDFKSAATMFHSCTTTTIATFLGSLSEISDEYKEMLYFGALTHDIGKIAIPAEVLEFKGRYTIEQMKIMQQHPLFSETILSSVFEEDIVKIATSHHERLNGKGYPYQKTNDELTICERIVSVADVTSALLLKRSYKDKYDWEKTLTILNEMVEEGHLDSGIVNIVSDHKENLDIIIHHSIEPLAEKFESLKIEFDQIMSDLPIRPLKIDK